MINTALVIITVCLLLYCSFTDLRTRDVPVWACLAGLVAGLILRLGAGFEAFSYGLLGIIILGGFGYGLYYYKLWGGGDFLIMLALGSLLGFDAWLLVLICGVGLFFLFLGFLLNPGKKEMPFVPPIAIATILFLVMKNGIIC